jgi:cohesin complex subunit SA-1/2
VFAFFHRVAHTLSDSDIPLQNIHYELVDLIVLSLRDMPEHKHLVCNWAAMLRALQGDEQNRRKSISKGDQRQDTVKQRVLLRMLVTAVTLEVTDAVTVDETIVDPDLIDARQAERKSLQATSTKTKKPTIKSSTSHEELTLALLRALPDLLVSFKSETSVLQSLTTLPQYFRKFKLFFWFLCNPVSLTHFLSATQFQVY